MKRELVSYLTVQFSMSLRQACRTLSLSRTVYFYQPGLRRDEPVIPAQRVVRVLDRVVAKRGYPLKMRMDKRPELISLTLAQWAEEHDVVLDFIKPGKPTQNTFIERFNRTYRTEILDCNLFRTLNEVREITERWLMEYNSERPHESLNNMTPEEYRLMGENA